MKPARTSYEVSNPERFWSKVDKAGDCWLWLAAKKWNGYGIFKVGGKAGYAEPAHRVAYYMARGEIPDGLGLDHLCRNRSCVNPAHLEPTTWRENIRRGNGVAGVHFRKTECKRGHPFNAENTYYFGPEHKWRQCKPCQKITTQAREARNRS